HEFDALGARIAGIKRIRIFGAGANGGDLHALLSPHLDLAGFIDNDPGKQVGGFLGMPVAAPARLDDNEAVVLALPPAAVPGALGQLAEFGFRENETAFPAQLFAPLYFLYARGRVCLPSLSFLPTTRCNLNCRHCLNFMPHIARHPERPLARLTRSLDQLFACVDMVILFHLSGGEPFLYRELAELIDYLGGRYGSRIQRLALTTNGTVMPSDEVCLACRRRRVSVTLDDYRASLPGREGRFLAVREKLAEFGVSFRVSRPEGWVDLTPPGLNRAD
ncbi:MAG: radical SAM protein, partial [Planctomycetota bacterium]|nr:radical SAM protein [Planctomycetota bacterium]